MSNKYYMKIEGITGPVKVANFDGCFELEYFNEGNISNPFTANNNGQSYAGVPDVAPSHMVVLNTPGSVSSVLMKKMLDATPLQTVTVYEIAKLNGQETSVYDVTFTEPHILSYERQAGSRNVQMVIGNHASIETNHTDIDETGKSKQYKVKYDLQKHVTS